MKSDFWFSNFKIYVLNANKLPKKSTRPHISILGEFKDYHSLFPCLSPELPVKTEINYFSRQVRPWEILGHICRDLGFLILNPDPERLICCVPYGLLTTGQRWPSKIDDGLEEQRRMCAPSPPKSEEKRQGWSCLLLFLNQPIRLSDLAPPWREASEEIERTWTMKQGEFILS